MSSLQRPRLSDETSPGDEEITSGPPAIPTNPTIVIQVDCEMANIMCKLSNGFAMKWILEDDHNISPNVIVKVYDKTTARAWKNMRLCFPKLRDLISIEGNTREFKKSHQQQQDWLGGETFPQDNSASSISQALNKFARVVANTSHPPPPLPIDANITFPFIISNLFARVEMIDRYFDKLEDLFEYDWSNPDCCGPTALPNEHIFHARGFEMEMGTERATKSNMLELSPNKTVTELLKNYQRDDRIAVLSRFPSFGQLYVDRMRSEGLDARVVETINGEHSFCFLMSGRNEVVGSSMSTFLKWASYLGNTSKSRIYFLRTPKRRAATGAIDNHAYDYTHRKLKGRISHEAYNSEALDEIERRRRLSFKSLH